MSYKRSSLMQERIEQNRKAILQSAKQLIAQGGFKEAQVQAIAELAGVSSGLVYRYFDNKSQILIEVLSQAIHFEVDILHVISLQELPIEQKLHKAVATFVKRALNSPQLSYSLMLEPVDAEVEYERFKSKKLIKDAIYRILEEGHTKGVFEFEDLNTTALCMVGAMTFSVIEPLDPVQKNNFNQAHKDYFSKQVADFCLNSVRIEKKFLGEDREV